ncbi:hypothetical protein [Methylosinus sp. PW1]|uniref:hypothetical protein n=1 Tax=Methylosinus sp. PW1 TaxID=107636 RepID=UPI0005601B12|nr:hypothetical protein [Methylosinus sp. PW1]
MNFIATMLGLAAVAFVQNMAFTAVSRSRNSGDVLHHAKWSVASNGVWFVMQILLWGTIWKAVEAGSWWQIAVAGAVYVAATTAGSCLMMAHMLRTEDGKRKVGAR